MNQINDTHEHDTSEDQAYWEGKIAGKVEAREEIERLRVNEQELAEALEKLSTAVSELPVRDWVEQENDGSPYLVGYVMQAQGEWDLTRSALKAALNILENRK